jgi:hypothetical protein
VVRKQDAELQEYSFGAVVYFAYCDHCSATACCVRSNCSARLRLSQNAYKWITQGGIQEATTHPLVVKGLIFVNEYLPFDNIDPQHISQKVAEFGSQLVTFSAKVLGDATNFLMDFLLMLFVLFFLLRDHDKIITAVRHILPLFSQPGRSITGRDRESLKIGSIRFFSYRNSTRFG